MHSVSTLITTTLIKIISYIDHDQPNQPSWILILHYQITTTPSWK
jgi:hypothetical protein